MELIDNLSPHQRAMVAEYGWNVVWSLMRRGARTPELLESCCRQHRLDNEMAKGLTDDDDRI
jgi:hypothetical protein